jgi:hypothetical protein
MAEVYTFARGGFETDAAQRLSCLHWNRYSLANPDKEAVVLRILVCCFAVCGLFTSALAQAQEAAPEPDASQEHLRLATYMTAGDVVRIFGEGGNPEEVLEVLAGLNISKIYLEVYRSGQTVPADVLAKARDFFQDRNIAVAGGIATVPGDDFGVRQDGMYDWFNWESTQTRHQIREVMRMASREFKEFIVDDFLCTDDKSAESEAAKGERSWGEYRRDLMADVSRETILTTAKMENRFISMTIKFPQWYDLFHRYGYDVPRLATYYDRVWVGTETRGMDTQRFGFTPPYMGFVNYRWIDRINWRKTYGAWFDHGDCTAQDFIDQAWQSVLAGAPELVLFNYGDLAAGHPGHALLMADLPKLRALCDAVVNDPFLGVIGVKVPNQEPGTDLFVMDFLGMLGIPLLPDAAYQESAKAIFLPAQAAGDPAIAQKFADHVQAHKSVVLTSGFLAAVAEPDRVLELAGIQGPIEIAPVRAQAAIVDGAPAPLSVELGVAARLQVADAEVLLEVEVDGARVPWLTHVRRENTDIYVLNSMTFTEEDYTAANEVLLAPRRTGLLEMPDAWVQTLRSAFLGGVGIEFSAPAKVTLQPVDGDSWLIQNYTDSPAQITLAFTGVGVIAAVDGFTDEALLMEGNRFTRILEPRERLWIKVAPKPLTELAVKE